MSSLNDLPQNICIMASSDCWQGETPIVHIAPDIMEEFLDDCLVGEGQITDKQFKITFRSAIEEG